MYRVPSTKASEVGHRYFPHSKGLILHDLPMVVFLNGIHEEYNHDRPHRGVGNRTPHEAFLAFAARLKNEALTV